MKKQHFFLPFICLGSLTLSACAPASISIEDAEEILNTFKEDLLQNKFESEWVVVESESYKIDDKGVKTLTQNTRTIYSNAEKYYHRMICMPLSNAIVSEYWEYIENNVYYKAKRIVSKNPEFETDPSKPKFLDNRVYFIIPTEKEEEVGLLWNELHKLRMVDMYSIQLNHFDYGLSIIEETKNPTIDPQDRPSYYVDSFFGSSLKDKNISIKGMSADKKLYDFDISDRLVKRTSTRLNESEEETRKYSYSETLINRLDLKINYPDDPTSFKITTDRW